MAWDDDKSTNDELTAQEWDNHVADQKGRAKNIVQASEPPVTESGTLWTELIDIFDKETTYVSADSLGFMEVTTDGKIVYIDSLNHDLVCYDIPTNTTLWTETAHTNTIEGFSISESADVVYSLSNPTSTSFTVASTKLSDGTNNYTETPSTDWVAEGGVDIGARTDGQCWIPLTEVDLNKPYLLLYDGGSTWTDSDVVSVEGAGYNGSEFILDGSNTAVVTDSSNTAYISAGGTGAFDSLSEDTQWDTTNDYGDGLFVFNDRLFGSSGTTNEISISDGTELWAYSASGNLGYDYTSSNVYIGSGADVYEVDAADGSEISTVTLPSGASATYVDYYNGETLIGDGGDDSIAVYGTINEYNLYVSNGTRWMNPNSY